MMYSYMKFENSIQADSSLTKLLKTSFTKLKIQRALEYFLGGITQF